MGFFEWKDEYSVGIQAIDRQHMKIIGLLEDLFESMRDGREDLVIRQTIEELKRYTVYHFELEASLFVRYAYPKTEEHLAQHRSFVERIAELERLEDLKAPGVPGETLTLLREWFRKHMQRLDVEYSGYYRERGLIDEIERAAP